MLNYYADLLFLLIHVNSLVPALPVSTDSSTDVCACINFKTILTAKSI